MYKVYFNGNIITMEDHNTSPEFLVEKKGKIIYVGNNLDSLNLKGDIEKIDLQNKTLMPSFIDAHSHFVGLADSLLSVVLNGVSSLEEMTEKINKYIESNNIKSGEWIIGAGFDNNDFENRYIPNRWDLDKISKENPIAIKHITNHTGIFNSLALEKLNINNETIAPDGGVIQKKDGVVTGYVEEQAYMKYIGKVPSVNIGELIDAVEDAQHIYASNGITTIQEGVFISPLIEFYKYLMDNDKLWLDIVGYPGIDDKENVKKELKDHIGKYKNNLKIGGYKIFLDGSLQTKTGWVKSPYIGEGDFKGYPTLKDEDVLFAINSATEDNLQILAHCNGDMAAQQFIDSCLKADKNLKNLRPVMIHAQLLDTNQLNDVKKVGIIPSFFIGHIFYWGDTHIVNFGKERVDRISMANTALKEDILFTFHQDTPVTNPDMFHSIWSGVNRLTKNNVLLGNDECISVKEALKAVTINSAYQYGEEDYKGSLKENKFADMIIVSDNPLKINPKNLKDIEVLETIFRGKTVFKK